MKASTDIDDKLINNIVDEISRLNSQLTDLEQYKEDFTSDEYEQIKRESLDQLIETTKMLEKFKSGNLTTKTAADEAKLVYIFIYFIT